MDGMDKVCDLVVGEAGHEFDPALDELFDDQRSRFLLFIAQSQYLKVVNPILVNASVIIALTKRQELLASG